VSQTFAEMMFKHGFVHCDPHAANMLVRPLPSSKASILGMIDDKAWVAMAVVALPSPSAALVLLCSLLYPVDLKPPVLELDFNTRSNYAALWKALIFADAKGIKECSIKLGVGEDLYPLFAGVLTMRPWNRVIDPSMDHLVIQGSESDRSELQMYASEYFHEISELLRRLPRVILLMMKTNDCLRAVNNTLIQGSSLETFFIIGKVSSEAVIEAKLSQSKSVVTWFNIKLDKILLEMRLWAMQTALWLLRLRKALAWSH
ncbi:ABC2, partial [Trifolium pratense]